ncbi:hypothetical protein GCM10020255_069890 [Rhodococcus baikonurensis]
MCGRYATTADPATLAVELDALDETDHSAPVEADYNVAPTTEVLTVVERHDRENPDSDPTKRIRRMRWGLVPSWTKELGKGPVLFNARADSLAEKPAFRTAFKFKRCLVPMDGWYEWQTEATGGKKAAKIPYYMHPDDGSRLFMAGVWSAWRDPRGENASPVLSCSIVTVDSLGHLEQVHDRMPSPCLATAGSHGSIPTTPSIRPCSSRYRISSNESTSIESGRWSTVSRTTDTS